MASGERESSLEEGFKEACATVWEERFSTQYDAVRMQLYGLYKVAKEGKCQEPKPKADTVLGGEKNRSKWMAWMKASTFSREEAMARYVSVALSVVKSRGDAAEGFPTGGVARVSGGGDGGVSVGASGASGGGGGGGAAAAGADGRKTSAGRGGEAADAQEVARLREHTESLERYVEMIRHELTDLDDVDVSMSGWLFKWRDQDAYLWGSVKWVPRFFTLSDGKLSTYKSDQSTEAESVMSLKRCVLRDEGTRIGKAPGRGKPRPEYHVFGLYLEGAMQRGPDAGVLLRLSTDKEDVAERWISTLGKVCAQEEDHSSPASSPCASEADQPEATSSACSSPVVTASMPPPPPPAQGLESASRMSRISSVRMSRKGSWDVAGGLENLKRLTQEVNIGRLDGDDTLERSGRVSDQGVARDEQDKRKTMVKAKKKKKKFEPTGYPASRPMHKEAKMSILSAGASSTQNYRGLLNLMAILLLVTNSRLIFANLRRYGVLATAPTLNEPSDLLDAPRIAGTLSLILHVVCANLIEKLAMPRPGNSKGMLFGAEWPVLLLHGINIFLCLGIAVAVVWRSEGSPVFGFAYLFTAVILWMKLISYAHCNRDLRLAWREKALAAKRKGADGGGEGGDGGGDPSPAERWRGGGTGGWSVEGFSDGGQQQQSQPGDVDTATITHYPDNIGVLNLLYFWFAPTLCYQPDYPRSAERHYRYILSLVVRLVIVGGAMSLISDQYMLPTVHEWYDSDPAANILVSIERLLTLAVPNTYVWLLGFYAFFHLTLNLLAEVLRFGDRLFYRDWWNSNTIGSYWRLWNLPVHYWMIRHIYFPSLRAGLSKSMASGLCFLLSAVLHELLVSVPFHMVKFYAFFGMIGNAPLVPLTSMLNKKFGDDQQAGNWLFWVLFCVVGQPMSLLCYYRDYCSEHECSNPLMS